MGPFRRSLDNAHVFFNFATAELPDFNVVRANGSWIHCTNAIDASFFVCADLDVVPDNLKWHAVLGGGTLCNWDFVKGIGISRSYNPCLKQRRFINSPVM